jgi:hypothetical protein
VSLPDRKLADDGFGNLVSVHNPYGVTTPVFARVNGKLARFDAGTPDFLIAIGAVRNELVDNHGDMRLGRDRWKNGPVLALIQRPAANGPRLYSPEKQGEHA